MSDRQAAVLFLRVPPAPPAEAKAYEQWYDHSHIRYRMDKPHFLGAERYDVLRGKHRYFVFYELSSPAALTTPEYLALRDWEAKQPESSFEAVGRSRPGFERGVYEQRSGPAFTAPRTDAPVAYAAGHTPAAADEDAFGTWYDDVHIPAVGRIAGVLDVRRFVLTKAQMGTQSGRRTERPTCVAVYYLASEAVAEDASFVREMQAAKAREGGADEPYFLLGRRAHGTVAAAATLRP